MALWLATRRRAEAFAAAVEAPASARDPRFSQLTALVDELQALPALEPDPTFVADLRARLMAEADTVLVPLAQDRAETRDRLTPARRRPRERRTAALAAGLAFVGAAVTVGVVADAAVPGDLLYPLKRGVEDTRTHLAFGDAAQGRRLLAQATERLDEVDRLAQRVDADPALTSEALADFREQATEGAEHLTRAYESEGDESAIRSVTTFTATSMETLEGLATEVPAEARDDLQDAADTLLDIDEEAVATCPLCGGPGITEIPVLLQSMSLGGVGITPLTGDDDGTLPTALPTDTLSLGPLPTLPSTLLPIGTGSATPSATGPTPAATTTATSVGTKKPTLSLPTSLPTSALTSILPTSILPSLSLPTSILPTVTLPTSILPSVSLPTSLPTSALASVPALGRARPAGPLPSQDPSALP